jgi:glycine betaine/proline transport system substrate-binding protein
MKALFKIFILIFSLISFISYSESKKAEKPINIIINDWSSQIVLSHITGKIFQSVNYKVNYSFSTSSEQWGALSQGIDHVQIEVWEGTMSKMFSRMVERGVILDAGSHHATTREDWWYPIYVEQICPELPDWHGLNKCAALFSNDNSAVGLFIAGPWEKPEAAKVRALGLNFKIEVVKETAELWQRLEDAKKNNKAVVLFNWSPNWVEAVYPGKFIEFPAYNKKCETDPKWGVNIHYLFDCGNPKSGWLKKAAWFGMPKNWPCAYQILQNISFTSQQIALLAAKIDYENQAIGSAVTRWMTDNTLLWQSWIPTQCKLLSTVNE